MIPKIRYTRSHGFTLMEVMFALCIFSVMILMFSSVFPSVLRGSHSSASYSQAALLAQHKVDQCREQGYGSIHETYGWGEAANSVSYSFTNIDNLGTGVLPPGSTGILTIGPPAGTSWTPAGSLVQVTVTISWPVNSLVTGQSTYNGKFQTHTLLMNAS